MAEEYIERDKFRNILEAKAEMAFGTPKQVFYNTIAMLDLIPAADVVEVVRCGQCKHATEDIIVEGVCYCHKIQQGMFLDGFCSYGERKCEDG